MTLLLTGANTAVFVAVPNLTVILAPNATATSLETISRGTLVVSYGYIESAADIAVTFQGSSSGQFINKEDGTAIGGTDAVRIETSASVVNRGVLLGESGHGIALHENANNNSIVNSGDIYGSAGGITVDAATALNVHISNSGEIRGDMNGIWLRRAPGAAPSIVNSGTIIGDQHSILAELGDRLMITNTGALVGHVRSTSANQSDSVTNNGTISGSVLLGSGNDLYKGTGTVSVAVYGEDGIDSLTGGGGVDRLFGGLGVDTLTGNAGKDVLNGGDGSDKLFGGLGIDNLTGGANNDFFVFNTAPNSATNKDVVVDFNPAQDTFQMQNAVFAKLGAAGGLNGAFFRSGPAALDANDYVVYNKANGILSYDSNGNAAGGVVQVAVLMGKPTLTAADFQVI